MKNKHLLILSFLLIVSSVCAIAQTVNPGDLGGLSMSDSTAKQIVDYSKLRIHYSMTFCPDAEIPNKWRRTETVLQIGKKCIRFMDYNMLRMDSITDSRVKSGISDMDYLSMFYSVYSKALFKPNIIMGYPGNQITTQEYIAFSDYEYVEDMPLIEWQLHDRTREIEGFNCKKATCSFRGRDYIAWYAEEIDLPYGPYKFGGLPGLIFLITDTQKQFQFFLNGIERLVEPEPIYLWTHSRIEKTDRDKARKIAFNFNADPAAAYSRPDSPSRLSEKDLAELKSFPYNPIELE